MTAVGIDGPVLVTGGASGIGLAIVQALTDADVPVGVMDLDAQALARLPHAAGGDVVSVHADVRDAEDMDAAVGELWGRLGHLGGLVNCAGVYPVTPFLDLSVAEWDEVLAVNLRAPFLVTQCVARRMVAGGIRGTVVNVSSSAATLCRPGVAHYGASKAGLNQLTRDMAIELAPHGIRVNAVAPGLVATERVMRHASGEGADEHAAKLARIPLAREGTADEIAPLVLMLLGEASSYCTGSVLLADGGVTLGIPSY